MVGSISQKLLTELGIRTEDPECKLMPQKGLTFVKNNVILYISYGTNMS